MHVAIINLCYNFNKLSARFGGKCKNNYSEYSKIIYKIIGLIILSSTVEIANKNFEYSIKLLILFLIFKDYLL